MRVINVRTFGGSPLAQMAIWPMSGTSHSMGAEQYKLAKYLNQATGLLFYFFVDPETILGWRVPDEEPAFEKPTADILGLYAGDRSKVAKASTDFLASLVEGWLADLATGWRSGSGPAPAESEMDGIGFLQPLRAL